MSAHVEELLGAWALDAVDGDEAVAIRAHLRGCADCSASADRLRAAAGWLGAEYVNTPPARLRSAVLDEARRRRPPVELRTLIEAYARQVRLLDDTLRSLAEADWRRPDPRHGDVTGLVRHLTRNDAALAADLSLPVIPSLPMIGSSPAIGSSPVIGASPTIGDPAVPVTAGQAYAEWRAQADVLLHQLPTDADLTTTVRLAARTGDCRGTLRDAMVQRAFETWTHLDDIRAQAGVAPSEPPAEHVRRIVALAVSLLPGALDAGSLSAPGSSSLLLTGSAGGEWTLPSGGLTIRADATEFVRLVANRRTPHTLAYAVDGDEQRAERMLAIAATLGCD